MATGAKARYNIPAFKSLAGPSPNCCAVLVQIEHCAKLKIFSSKKVTTKTVIFPACMICCFNIGAKLSMKQRLKKQPSLYPYQYIVTFKPGKVIEGCKSV